MRSSSHCESYCAPPLCYFPCLPKSKDDAGGGDPKPAASPSPAAVAQDKPPVVQKMEEPAPPPSAAVAATGGDDGGGDDDNNDKCYREVAVATKSCLKRANCEDSSSKIAAKGNVKWRDLLGKDLTQVKEFEPSESGDSDDEEYTGACACVIQ